MMIGSLMIGTMMAMISAATAMVQGYGLMTVALTYVFGGSLGMMAAIAAGLAIAHCRALPRAYGLRA